MTDARIDLTLQATTDELLHVSGHLGREATHQGWLRGRSLLTGASGPVVAGLIAAFAGRDVGTAVLFAALAVSVSLAVDQVASHAAGKRFRALLRGSALRQRATHATLTRDGISLAAVTLPWSAIRSVDRWRENTLLRCSPVDAIVIRDLDLPHGIGPDEITPARLIEQIQDWKTH